MRLIDADVVVKGLNRWKNKLIQTYGENDEFVRCIDRIIDNYIDNEPTIDAEPVRHGHWIKKINPQCKAFSHDCCSECGWWNTRNALCYDGKHKLGHSLNYCPHCGAKMDEEDNT